MQPKGYIKGVRELTKKYDVLLIVDEVATGFGRTGKMWACDNEGVCPDLMTLSKGITGGYLALGATMVTDEIYNAFLGEPTDYKTFYHGTSRREFVLDQIFRLQPAEIIAVGAIEDWEKITASIVQKLPQCVSSKFTCTEHVNYKQAAGYWMPLLALLVMRPLPLMS